MHEFPSIEKVKEPVKKVVKAAENAFFNYDADRNTELAWQVLADPEQGKFLKTQALFVLLRSVVPDRVFEKLTGETYKYQSGVLPIDPEKYAFNEERVGGGYECNVYRLIPQQPDLPTLVIKIDQYISRSTDKLLERAKAIRSEYNEKKEWYSELPEFIPDELHFIGQSPRGGKAAVFTIQEYLGNSSQMKDIFRDMTKEELIETLQGDEELRSDFKTFVEITVKRAEGKDEMIDTVGYRNLVLVEREGKKKLIFLDPHSIKHPVADKDSEKIQADLNFLKEVLRRIS